MHVTAHLDVDVIALEQDDVVSVLLELQSPAAVVTEVPRTPHTIVVVLDRSGSMTGPRLFAAKEAMLSLIDRLAPDDRLGLIAFDDSAQVVLSTRSLADHGKLSAKTAVRSIEPGGSTDLSSGYLRGLQEAKGALGASGATIVVLSDGQANAGVTDPASLKRLAADSRTSGITTSTIGIGLGYDEQVLVAMTEGGAGNHSFAEQAEAAAVALASEVDGLLNKNAQAASLLIKPGDDISTITVLNDLPSTSAADGILVELGDFYAGETRRLVLSLDVPARESLGTTQIAELVFRYVELPALVEHVVTVPVSVNVLPGDEAAGRVRAPEVEQEKLLLEVQSAKRQSEEALREGDIAGARMSLDSAIGRLGSAPAPSAAMLSELSWFRESVDYLDSKDAAYSTRRMAASRAKTTSGKRDRLAGGEF